MVTLAERAGDQNLDNVRDLVGKTEDRPQNVILADSVGSQPEVPIMMDTYQHSHLHCPESAG
jgi:hypothetical protein